MNRLQEFASLVYKWGLVGGLKNKPFLLFECEQKIENKFKFGASLVKNFILIFVSKLQKTLEASSPNGNRPQKNVPTALYHMLKKGVQNYQTFSDQGKCVKDDNGFCNIC